MQQSAALVVGAILGDGESLSEHQDKAHRMQAPCCHPPLSQSDDTVIDISLVMLADMRVNTVPPS